jgi:hypothetical protein
LTLLPPLLLPLGLRQGGRNLFLALVRQLIEILHLIVRVVGHMLFMGIGVHVDGSILLARDWGQVRQSQDQVDYRISPCLESWKHGFLEAIPRLDRHAYEMSRRCAKLGVVREPSTHPEEAASGYVAALHSSRGHPSLVDDQGSVIGHMACNQLE